MFYVTVRDGRRTGFLLGPFVTHDEALENVQKGNNLACKVDPKAHWYAFGTAKVKEGPLPVAVFSLEQQ